MAAAIRRAVFKLRVEDGELLLCARTATCLVDWSLSTRASVNASTFDQKNRDQPNGGQTAEHQQD